MKNVEILDSTLRDGAQGEGISFSVTDKINIVKTLDELGVAFIEAGNPSSNPKDLEFFSEAKKLKLKNSIITAFGATRKKGIKAYADEGIKALIGAETSAVSIVGKASVSNLKNVLGVSAEENLNMISETVSYLKQLNKFVIFDAEHYFDGFTEDKDYALKVVETAQSAGADRICLCDTNGGTLPDAMNLIISETIKANKNAVFGIHTHNDSGCAVANSIIAVDSGVFQVQGTLNGVGERCGNAELSSVIANLSLKRKINCIKGDLKFLKEASLKIAEITNINLSSRTPYVGESAFAHKGGMHIDGVLKNASSFEHINPADVGNKRRFLTSEVAGKHAVVKKIQKFIPDIKSDSPLIDKVVKKLKEQEHLGYQYEAADASFELLILEAIGRFKPHFKLDMYKTSGEFPAPDGEMSANALLKIKVDNKTETAGSVGNGPVHALDNALRKALSVFYPEIAGIHLIDYKVRVLTAEATAAKVRVLIESTDGERVWTTVGVSTDIIEASFLALKDSIEYILYILIEGNA